MHFDPFSYVLGEFLNRTQSLSTLNIKGSDVFIVGSGPSIDRTRLDQISNANVVLLNSAYQLAPRFGSNNNFYWFCQDTVALLKLGPHVPTGIKKIVTVHRFNRLWSVRKFLHSDDIYLQPRLGFRRNSHATDLVQKFTLLPRPLFKLTSPLLHSPSAKRVALLPSTVMLTAISIFGGLGSTKITCLGFDLTPPTDDKSRVSAFVNQPYRTGSLPAKRIETLLAMLKVELDGEGQSLVNGSPGTFEAVLPKTSRYC